MRAFLGNSLAPAKGPLPGEGTTPASEAALCQHVEGQTGGWPAG